LSRKRIVKLKPYKFCAVNIVKHQIDQKLLDLPEARLVFAIISNAQDDATTVNSIDAEEARSFINPKCKDFIRWCELIGLDEEWVSKILNKEIKAHDDYVLYQHQLFFCLAPFVLMSADYENCSIFYLVYAMRLLAKKLSLSYFYYAEDKPKKTYERIC
jgi:hypothetical protein